MRGYNAIFACQDGNLGWHNSLRPSPDAAELSYDEWARRLAEAGVDRVRHKFTGRNDPLRSGARAFEPEYGRYNDWGGRLTEAVAAALTHDLRFHAIPFESDEWRDGWAVNPWNSLNGGFLDDPRAVFTHPDALDAAKARIDAIVRACERSVGAWELCAEMSWIVQPAFWQVATWAEMIPVVRGILVPWVETLARYIHTIHPAPVGNGQVFAPAGFSPKPDHPSRLRNEVYMTPALDFALINWYGDGPVRDKVAWLRACQQVLGKPVYVEQYAPWDLGRGAPYTREPSGFPWSKTHEWAAVCGEYGAVGPFRWPEIRPEDEYPTWWGIASPEMAAIAGVTRAYAARVDLGAWDGRGEAWEGRIASNHLAWASAWGDGAHATMFLSWTEGEPHEVAVSGMQDGTYDVWYYDWLVGDEIEGCRAEAQGGMLVLDDVPHRENRCALYLARYVPPPPVRHTMTVTAIEWQDDVQVATWTGELERVPQ